MRQQFVKTVTDIMAEDEKVVLLLGDISVFGFRHCFERWPDRCFNFGACEQTMVSAAAGLALTGFYPITHTIASFLCRRAYEQIYLDFGAQRLGGLFVSVGCDKEYEYLGQSHWCREDRALMAMVAGMCIESPRISEQADDNIRQAHSERSLTYIRLCKEERIS